MPKDLTKPIPQEKIKYGETTKLNPNEIPNPHFEDETRKLIETTQEDIKAANIDQIQQLLEKRDHRELPREGSCIYLMFNLEPQQNQKTLSKIIADIKLYEKSQDYYIWVKNGFLTIVGTSERASNDLYLLTSSIQKAMPEAQMFIGSSQIKHDQNNFFHLEDHADVETQNKWKTYGPGLFSSKTLEEARQNPNTREGSHYNLETLETTYPDLIKVLKYIPKVSDKIGGPDKLIGYKKELEELQIQLIKPENKLTLLKGEAGIGKSRIILEMLNAFPKPAHIICSLDANNKNTPGASLVTLANQICTGIDEDPLFQTDDSSDMHQLQNFNQKSIAEKIDFAQKNTTKLVSMCSEALNFITFSRGNEAILIIEDLHNTDRYSAKWIAEIVRTYLQNTESKALISMRPEEMYQTDAQKDLVQYVEGYYGENSSSEIHITGLNFSDDNLAYEFTYHSIPQNLRTNRKIGTWYQNFGKIAGNSPFIMASLLNGVLEKAEENLIISDESINLSKESLEQFSQIKPGDKQAIAVYFHQRIANLDQKAKRVIQSIALAGGKLNSEQISSIITNMGGKSVKDFVDVSFQLSEGKYIKESETTSSGKIIELQHEMLLDFILSSISDPEEKFIMSRYLYGLLEKKKGVHPDVKFSLLHNMAQGSNPSANRENFWTTYKTAAENSLEDAQNNNDKNRAYALSRSILDESEELSTITEELSKLQETKIENKDLAHLITTSLFALAESAMHLGKFDEVKKTIVILEKIRYHNRELVDKDKVSLMKFEQFYLERNRKTMKLIYEKEIQNSSTISNEEKTICRIKLAFREGLNKTEGVSGYDTAIQILNENSELNSQIEQILNQELESPPSPELIEIARLIKIRIPFANLRRKIENINEDLKLDEDIVMQANAVRDHLEELLNIQKDLIKIQEIQEQFPLILGPSSELSLLDISGQIESYLGNFEIGTKIISEAWRQADQMDLNEEAARYAKIKGDMFTIQALLEIDAQNQVELLSQAINTYSKEGIISVDQLNEGNFYNLAMRIQRIRAIGLICLYQQENTGNLNSYIQKALEDFQVINEIIKTEEGKEYHNPEVCYYLLGYIGHILNYARENGLQIDDIYEEDLYPFMNTNSVFQGLEYGKKVTDITPYGESYRKETGLFNLYQHLKAIQTHKSLE